MGDFDKLSHFEVMDAQAPCFKDVTYEVLPPHALPRLPLKILKYHGGSVWCLQGPCHASKNAAGQLTSLLRTIYFGQYFVDHSGSRQFGTPPVVFRRGEPMSDSMNAALFNPLYVISSPVYTEMSLPSTRVLPTKFFCIGDTKRWRRSTFRLGMTEHFLGSLGDLL